MRKLLRFFGLITTNEARHHVKKIAQLQFDQIAKMAQEDFGAEPSNADATEWASDVFDKLLDATLNVGFNIKD